MGTWYHPDLIRNSDADSFISFLKDNRSVILNGRVTPHLLAPEAVQYQTTCSAQLIITLLVSDVAVMNDIQPPRILPDHSLLRGTFKTSFYSQTQMQYFPSHFPGYIPNQNKDPLPTPTKKLTQLKEYKPIFQTNQKLTNYGKKLTIIQQSTRLVTKITLIKQ